VAAVAGIVLAPKATANWSVRPMDKATHRLADKLREAQRRYVRAPYKNRSVASKRISPVELSAEIGKFPNGDWDIEVRAGMCLIGCIGYRRDPKAPDCWAEGHWESVPGDPVYHRARCKTMDEAIDCLVVYSHIPAIRDIIGGHLAIQEANNSVSWRGA